MAKKMWVSFIVYFTLFSRIFADQDPFTMQYLEGDRATLNCAVEYNETIQLSSVLYNYSTCSHGDKYGIQNLCDGRKSCSFDVPNSNIGSSCGADGKASLQVSYNLNEMEAGQIGLGIQLVVLLVVEVHNCILEVVQIRHQM